MEELVSCLLATRGRPSFLRQAIRCYQRQTYAHRELFILDDSARPDETLVLDDPTIRYLWLERPLTLGAKLNLGAEMASGSIFQKLDDDDYYHPRFLDTTVNALNGTDPERTVAAYGSFLVLLAKQGTLHHAGDGWCAGPTLCFNRKLWARRPFRDEPRAVDWWFLRDHKPERIYLRNAEYFVLVRHGFGHTWTQLGDGDVEGYFENRPQYRKPLEQVMGAEDLAFYRALKAEGPILRSVE